MQGQTHPVQGSGFGLRIVEGGFPHSEISGSKLVRSSPKLIAAYHVLHRLSAPRHPPNALKALDRSHDRWPPPALLPTCVLIRKTIFMLAEHIPLSKDVPCRPSPVAGGPFGPRDAFPLHDDQQHAGAARRTSKRDIRGSHAQRICDG